MEEKHRNMMQTDLGMILNVSIMCHQIRLKPKKKANTLIWFISHLCIVSLKSQVLVKNE